MAATKDFGGLKVALGLRILPRLSVEAYDGFGMLKDLRFGGLKVGNGIE